MPDSQLAHYGVLGMKWGVRKDGMPQGYQGTGKGRRKSDRGEKPSLDRGGTHSSFSVNREAARKAGIAIKKRPATQGQDINEINKRTDSDYQEGRLSNCTFCSMAYDLRRRGYDVTAGKSFVGMNDKAVASMYKDGKPKRVTKEQPNSDPVNMKRLYDTDRQEYMKQQDQCISKVEKELSSQPEGSRGLLMFHYESGGGHCVAYEVKGGKPVVVDAQIQKTKTVADTLSSVNFKKEVKFMRTDNKEPNLQRMKDYDIIRSKGKAEKMSFSEKKESAASKRKVKNEIKQTVKEIKSIEKIKDAGKQKEMFETLEKKHGSVTLSRAMDQWQQSKATRTKVASIAAAAAIVTPAIVLSFKY